MTNLYLEKIASLLKNRRLLMKAGPKNTTIMANNAQDMNSVKNMQLMSEGSQAAVDKGHRVKLRLKFTDGSTGLLRGKPGKGIRSRLYKE